MDEKNIIRRLVERKPLRIFGKCILFFCLAGGTEARIVDASLSPHSIGDAGVGVSCAVSTNTVLYGSDGDPRIPDAANKIQFACSSNATAAVIRTISDVERTCGSVAKEYRIDCLGDGLVFIGRNMPKGDYKAAGTALKNAGSRLRTIAKLNRDKSKPELGLNSSGTRWTGSKKFTPVKSSNLKAATAKAIAVIREAETIILRSGENSDRRRTHYQKIAKQLKSTTRILRS